jgi:hypothetical protein
VSCAVHDVLLVQRCECNFLQASTPSFCQPMETRITDFGGKERVASRIQGHIPISSVARHDRISLPRTLEITLHAACRTCDADATPRRAWLALPWLNHRCRLTQTGLFTSSSSKANRRRRRWLTLDVPTPPTQTLLTALSVWLSPTIFERFGCRRSLSSPARRGVQLARSLLVATPRSAPA